MGAGHSSEQAEDQDMETLYDILGVEKNATDVDLKKAYKKQALLLHPDRNYENPGEATRKFARIQAAYDVLSDPQERAWYNSHGSELGRTGADDLANGGGKVISTEELKKYFDPTYYQNVGGRKERFYDLIGQLFERLAKEEHEAALDIGLKEPLLPMFGSDNSPWRDVKSFYDAWTSFSSAKDFAWEDIYRAWDAPDRRSRRAMQVRNKKIRDAAKKEFNETVRALSSLIKQKDPRVKAQNKMSKTKAADSAAKENAKRARSEQAAKRGEYEEQEWSTPDPDAEAVHQGSDSDSGETVIIFECIVCDKTFKTKKQLVGHEASKKHIKNLHQLRKEMRREGVELGFDEDDDEEDFDAEEESRQNSTEENVSNRESDKENEGNNDDDKVLLNRKVNGKDGLFNDTPVSSQSGSDSEPEPKLTSSKDPTLEELLAQLEGAKIERSSKPEPAKKQGKAKQRRSKKEKATTDFANKCGVCQTEFSSRNKLFEHVKVSQHAVSVKR